MLLDEHSFLGKKTKLAPKWSGPHRILKLKNENNVEIKLETGHSLITHVNHLKPYQVPLGETHEFKENFFASPTSPVTAQQVSKAKTKFDNEFEDYLDWQSEARPMPNPTQAKPIQPSMAMPQVDPDVAVDKPSFAQKRGWVVGAKLMQMLLQLYLLLLTMLLPHRPLYHHHHCLFFLLIRVMTLRSGRSYQPAVTGGGNPDVQVSVINTDDEWVTVIHSKKTETRCNGASGPNWSVTTLHSLETLIKPSCANMKIQSKLKHQHKQLFRFQLQSLYQQLYHRMWQFLIRTLAILTSIGEVRVHHKRMSTTVIQITPAHCYHCRQTHNSISIQQKEVQILQVSQRSLNELLIGQTTEIRQ